MTTATITAPGKRNANVRYAAAQARADDLLRRSAEAQARADAYKAELEVLKQMRADIVEIAKECGIDLSERAI